MDIALVMIPFAESFEWDFGIFGKNAKEFWTIGRPLGLTYIASVLRNEGHKIKIIDCMAENLNPQTLEEQLRKTKFDVIGLSVVTPAFIDAIVSAKIAKRVNPKCKVVIGGAHVTVMERSGKSEKLFETPEFDFAVYGEGEITMKELANAIAKKTKDYSKIDGLIWRSGKDGADNKSVVVNKPRVPIENLDILPLPAIDLLKTTGYSRSPSSVKREPAFSVMTARGCPYDCIFCNKVFGHKVRRRSVKNVMKELWYLKKKMGAREIRFWDETFTLDKKYIIDMCKEMIRSKLKLLWSCNGHVNTLDAETLSWMKKAGCWEIDFGIESGNDQVLKDIQKNITKDQTRRDIKLVKKAGIEPRTFFIFGFPTDTKKTVEETIDFAVELDATYATFYKLQVYPGTKLFFKLINDYGEDADKIIDTIMKERVYYYYNKKLSDKQLVNYIKIAHRRFYLRPSYIIKMVFKIRSFEDLWRHLKAGIVMLKVGSPF
jgi:radical SAM superfamily enzyme YgiQ (UPF0313 family)